MEPVLLTGRDEDDRPRRHLDRGATPSEESSSTGDDVDLILGVRLLRIAGACRERIRADAEISGSQVFAIVGA